MARDRLGMRLLVSAVGVPIGVLAIYLGGWAMGVLGGAIAWLAADEFYGIAAHGPGRPFRLLGGGAAAGLVVAASLRPNPEAVAATGWILTVGVVLWTMAAGVFRGGARSAPLHSTSVTLAGMVYGGGMLSFAPLIWDLPHRAADPGPLGPWAGPILLIYVFTVTFMGDTMAYFVGTHLGRRKLIPSVSPSKTVEGSIGGLAASALTGVLFGALALRTIPVWGLSALEAGALALLLGAVAQVADLAESAIKREAGVKDSGSVLPGHGGILDRFDGVLFSLPTAYAVLVLREALT